MQVRRRLVTPGDEAFVKRLIVATVAEDLQAWAWPETLRTSLLEMQYRGRLQSIDVDSPTAEKSIILAGDDPVGWVVIDWAGACTNVVDIAILGQHRGAGIGGAVLREIIEESAGKPVALSVNITNRAARLYERLGFKRVGGDEVQHFLERLPD